MVILEPLPLQRNSMYKTYYKVIVDKKDELVKFYSKLLKYATWRPDKDYWVIVEDNLQYFPQFLKSTEERYSIKQ
jgi:hypothetical protein